jgi:hypothetical protein
MTTRLGVTLLLVVLAGVPTAAQPAIMLTWTQPGVSPVDAQGYLYRYSLDGLPGVLLAGVTCAVVDAATDCRAPFPTPAVGVHSLTLTAANEYGEGPPSPTLTFRYPVVPGAPMNLRIVRGESTP